MLSITWLVPLILPNLFDVILPPVNSADVTAWAESLPDTAAEVLCMEIRVDQMLVQTMKAVKRSTLLTWDEIVPMYVH
jgi:hypothetical protein